MRLRYELSAASRCRQSTASVAVAAGAFGAHGLQVDGSMRMSLFRSLRRRRAIRCIMRWRLELRRARRGGSASPVANAAAIPPPPLPLPPPGIVLFSGLLYAFALHRHARGLGIMTPFGGLSFLDRLGGFLHGLGCFEEDCHEFDWRRSVLVFGAGIALVLAQRTPLS